MKRFYIWVLNIGLVACSALAPYKNQTLDYLKDIEQRTPDYQGKIVSFGGEVKGITEDTQFIRLVLKTEVPLYYSAVGKRDAYELILVEYAKPVPSMSAIAKGETVRVLARVHTYEKRKNTLDMPVGVLRLRAFALSNRSQKKDFFHTTSPEKQLYESWKQGRLFYQESAEEIVALYPAETPATLPPTNTKKTDSSPTIVYDEVEDFVIQ